MRPTNARRGAAVRRGAPRGVGGPVDVAVITSRHGFRFLQKKEVALPPEESAVVCEKA
jgi:hypothetical protein